jgi:CSLREA domain-containing protein
MQRRATNQEQVGGVTRLPSVAIVMMTAVAAVFLVLLSTTAQARTIYVTSLADPGAPGTCALRDAITAANTGRVTNRCAAGTGGDTIQFMVSGQIRLANTLPRIVRTLTIIGRASADITIDGGTAVQVMQVAAGANASS